MTDEEREAKRIAERLEDARDVASMAPLLEGNGAFLWFCERMERQALAAIRTLDPESSTDRRYVDRVTEAQTLASLRAKLVLMRERAEAFIEEQKQANEGASDE